MSVPKRKLSDTASVSSVGRNLELYGYSYASGELTELITLYGPERSALLRFLNSLNLEPNAGLESANLEPAENGDLEPAYDFHKELSKLDSLFRANLERVRQLGTEAPTWNQTANLEPAKSRKFETEGLSRNEADAYRRALAVAVTPAVVHDSIGGVRNPTTIAREIREIVDRIISELEGADRNSTQGVTRE